MSTRIELSELETYLYASADILRGHVDASDYKSFIFPLLFFKRICDIYDEETEQLVKEYGEEGAAFMGASSHKFKIPKGSHWKDVRNATENIGAVIVKAFYPLLLIVSYKFSIPIHPLGMVRTRGKIIFCKNSFTSYALRVTNILLLAFHSD